MGGKLHWFLARLWPFLYDTLYPHIPRTND